MLDPVIKGSSDPDLIAEEHARLRRMVRSLERAGDAQTGAALLEELARLLRVHFEHEEAPGGLYDSIRETAPRYGPVLEQLSHQHSDIVQSVRRLRERVSASGADWLALKQEVADFALLISQHEERETELLNDSVLLDIGTSE
jgi:hypothetical protein